MAEKAAPDDGIGAMTTLTVAIIFGGVVFSLTNGHHGRCAGAPRSVRLQFEQRKAEMKEAASKEMPATDSVEKTND